MNGAFAREETYHKLMLDAKKGLTDLMILYIV